LKVNYIGIVASIIAFISLALPWWTVTMSAEFMGIKVSADVSVYPSQATASALGISQSVAMNLWFSWATLALIVTAGVAAIVGSLIIGKTGKIILMVAGILMLLSIIIFASGLQSELSKGVPAIGFPKVGLFSSGSWSFFGVSMPMDYSSYLSVGFWLALVAAILAFISLLKHPVAPPPAPPAAPPTPES
jgi:hypothetical protein